MEKFVIQGGTKLKGSTKVSGAKNVALKALVAACLTNEEVIIHNVPLLSDVQIMIEIIEELGGEVNLSDHTLKIQVKEFRSNKISLDGAAQIRTASMFIAPLLARCRKAIIPNPGGCRIGARPIDRTVEGLKQMGAVITYSSDDGYFHAHIKTPLQSTNYTFEKNTHTGTETMLIAAVLAKGKTILSNAAAEPEVNELINLLNLMGGKIRRVRPREIEIEGVEKLHGAEITILPDRNEVVTFGIAAIATKGDIIVEGAKKEGLEEFLEKLEEAGGGFTILENGIRFYYKGQLKAVEIETRAYPAFMTDWQAPWAILMTQANGISTIHETVFENRFGYVRELRKMGAEISYFEPKVNNSVLFYNFNYTDKKNNQHHAIKIEGPAHLHNAVVNISDLRAGATLVIAALVATGESTVHGIHYIHRGYETFERRLQSLGANISLIKDERV